jgi:hypothetical protein
MADKFSTDNFFKLSDEIIHFQLNTLYPIEIKNEPERINLVFLNHDRNLSTYLTIRYLVEHERVADIYTLSRSMYESVISMALLAKNIINDDIIRYQDFQYLEIYKTHEHLKRLGLAELNGLSEKEALFVKNKRDAYIARWGNSNLSWTGNSLESNVKIVDRNYAPTCNENHFYEYLYCQVYRKGSQSTHSSFAGLSKGVVPEKVCLPGLDAYQMGVNEPHLIFSCFHSLLVFLSSMRFMGEEIGKTECESYFQKKAKYIITED